MNELTFDEKIVQKVINFENGKQKQKIRTNNSW